MSFHAIERRTCTVCGEPFVPVQPNHSVCADACRQKLRFGNNPFLYLPGPTVGSIAELYVAADLMKAGWHVFRALALHAFCDLIASRDGVTRFVEVRSGVRNRRGDFGFSKECGPGATEFAVWLQATGEIQYLDILDITTIRQGRLKATRIVPSAFRHSSDESQPKTDALALSESNDPRLGRWNRHAKSKTSVIARQTP